MGVQQIFPELTNKITKMNEEQGKPRSNLSLVRLCLYSDNPELHQPLRDARTVMVGSCLD